MAIKFQACRLCWDNECDVKPGNTATKFTREVTQTSTEYGTVVITLDPDGDETEGDTDWGDSESNGDYDYGRYKCQCCEHSFAVLDVDDELVTLKFDSISDTVEEWDDEEDEAEASPEPTYEPTPPTYHSNGKRLGDDALALADMISSVTEDARPDTTEINLDFLT